MKSLNTVISIIILNIFLENTVYASWYEGYSPWGHTKTLGSGSRAEKTKTEAQINHLIELELFANAEIKSRQALLADIVSCRGDEVICSEIYSVDVGVDFGKVSKKILSSGRIKNLIKAENFSSNIALGGARSVKIQRKIYTIRGDEIRKNISNILENNLHCGEDCKLDTQVSAIFQKFQTTSKDWLIRVLNLDDISLQLNKKGSFSTIRI